MKKIFEDMFWKKCFAKPFIDSKGNKHLETQAHMGTGAVH